MPDKRMHRGQHPKDAYLFRSEVVNDLRSAVRDFSWLLTRGYPDKGALKLVGDRFSLTERQRLAVLRSSCSDGQLRSRRRRLFSISKASRLPIAADGYNVLITIEAAISKGVIFRGRDGTFKDLASIHGTYRKVKETYPAVKLIGEFLAQEGFMDVLWLLDSPVSNSGRLKTLIAEIAEENSWKWDIRLSANPDTQLTETERIAASSDGVILDGCKRWVNLAAEIIKRRVSDAWVIDLSGRD